MLYFYCKIMITNFLILFKKSPLLAFIKFEPTFLTDSLAVCLSARLALNRSGKDNFKFFFGGNSIIAS